MATSSIDSLQKTVSKEPYTVKASVDGSALETTEVTGDRTSSAFADASKKEMGKTDFLTLLTQQLKYQDPLKPMENTEFVSQLAQFSQLETMSNVGTSMETLKKSFETSLAIQSNSAQSVTNSTSVSLIGKDVRLRLKEVEWTGKGSADVRVHLGSNKAVNVKILDEKDNVVREIAVSKKDATNAGVFNWDGKDVNGKQVTSGSYKLVVDGEDKDPSLYCFVEDTVDGVRYTAQGPVVKVAGSELPVGNILEVHTESSTAQDEFVNLNMSQALGLVGKNVKFKDGGTTFAPEYGKTRDYLVDFAGKSSATVVLKDGNGVVIQKYELDDKGGTGGAKVTIPLDDKTASGGKYSVSIEGNDGAYFYKQSTISGVIPTAGGVQLKADGSLISAKNILEVFTPSVV